MVDRITTSASGGMVFEGSGVEVFRLLAIAQALDLYGRTGIKANTAYTRPPCCATRRRRLESVIGAALTSRPPPTSARWPAISGRRPSS